MHDNPLLDNQCAVFRVGHGTPCPSRRTTEQGI
jgi:hypothetical protein